MSKLSYPKSVIPAYLVGIQRYVGWTLIKRFEGDDFKTKLIGSSDAPQLAAQELSSLNVAAVDEFLDIADGRKAVTKVKQPLRRNRGQLRL